MGSCFIMGEAFAPLQCTAYPNCTSSDYVQGWSEENCIPSSIKNIRLVSLSIIGIVGIVGVIANATVLSSFLYVNIFKERIRKIFGRDRFSYMNEPIFLLICHLSFCDLLYCLIGLPSYWFIYYNGYFPWSHNACKGIAFMSNSIAYADFHTLAAVTVYIALPKKMKISHKATLIIIWLIWMIALATASSPLSGLIGEFGYDACLGKCHIISCTMKTTNGWYLPAEE